MSSWAWLATAAALAWGWWQRRRVGRLNASLQECTGARGRAERTAAETAARLQHALTILRHLPMGVVQVDEEGIILWLNPAAEEWLAIDALKHVGQPLALFLPQPGDWSAIRNSSEGRVLQVRQANGEERSLCARWWPLGEGGIVWLEDLTERERVAAMRRDFVANVSHELRTPLTLLIGALETLTDPEFVLNAEKRHELLLRSEAEARRMLRLVSDLLQLAELEGGGKPERVWVPVIDLVDEAIEIAVSLAPEGLEVERSLQPEVARARLLGDADELASALRNLVSNAVRYTPPPGRVTVGARVHEGGWLALVVQDTGIGIAPEHLPRLTERFYRVDRARSRASGGTGLGLAIVRHIADRHEARLAIESRLGEGSSFALVFPPGRWRAS
ncbi:MAG: ATP-binding protein [Hydrogenophilus sp.]|nr:ATP-binding protein [Hydrogenophilus sp.]